MIMSLIIKKKFFSLFFFSLIFMGPLYNFLFSCFSLFFYFYAEKKTEVVRSIMSICLAPVLFFWLFLLFTGEVLHKVKEILKCSVSALIEGRRKYRKSKVIHVWLSRYSLVIFLGFLVFVFIFLVLFLEIIVVWFSSRSNQ